MIIQTKYLGEVEIAEDQIIKFPQGVLGFEQHQEFIILDIFDNDNFKILQDLKHPNIAFFIINPWNFYKDYIVDIPDEELGKIGIFPSRHKDKDIMVFNIVTLGKTFKESTANLLAPIVINMVNREGRQFIQNNTEYSTRHKLFSEGNGE
ncbi:MAG: flagellar assembly protein FliW [Tissierellaceae bacterium]|nr:flagellar assembly protein FliW [Tissierellaceae bacterium]